MFKVPETALLLKLIFLGGKVNAELFVYSVAAGGLQEASAGRWSGRPHRLRSEREYWVIVNGSLVGGWGADGVINCIQYRTPSTTHFRLKLSLVIFFSSLR